MSAPYRITRRIEIDAGHRIQTHGSKCRHIHGHRYGIEAVVEAMDLADAGEQQDMVLDFGFLKDEMMQTMDVPCDHGFIASINDLEVLGMFAPMGVEFDQWHAKLAHMVQQTGEATTQDTRLGTKLTVIAPQPTAEALARHWFKKLAPRVVERSNKLGKLVMIRVFETPNCCAEYGE